MEPTRSSAEILTEPPPPDADARLAYGPEPLQFGDLRLPEGGGPHPLVVVIHGGYWQSIYNLIHAGHLCVDLEGTGSPRGTSSTAGSATRAAAGRARATTCCRRSLTCVRSRASTRSTSTVWS
jgi:hypothetical protein